MTTMKAQARFIMVSRFTDNGAYSHCALVDSTTGRELGCDGGEPEDQLLTRDWAWVADELNSLAAALTDAYARGRRDQLDVDMRTVQSLCNEECKAYKQDKSGCNHPDGESVHNGNVVRVADNFRIWYISEVATKEGK